MEIVGAQDASSSDSPCSYHVFLSFSGEDTGKRFTDHLYTALKYAGFRTFRDDDEIERGENIKFELHKAIQESRISIVVFSKNYASSSWCLDELLMILKRRKTTSHVVLPVFYHVNPSHVRKQMGSFKKAFMRHKKRFHTEAGEIKDDWKGKMQEWRAALREAADLAGMNLQNQADGFESKFIHKIVEVVADKLKRTILGNSPYLIGIHSRAKNIGLWLQDGSSDVGIVAICGIGGIGKTTIAKVLYNLNFSRFEGSSFLANVREILKQPNGLLQLQRQLLADILKGRKKKLYSVDEGIVKIKDALRCKRILIILDDVDTIDQLDAILGMRDWLFQGSKIIITTRRERLLRAHEICHIHKVEILDNDKSLELFSWHAFGQNRPIDGFIKESKRVVQYCGGLPLAIKILGSSLSGKSLNVWKSQLEKLKAIPDYQVIEKLKISYDSLQDDHDKNLFLHVACFFVGMDADWVVTILDGCDFYTTVGIQNLIDRSLLTIDEHKKLVMHQLIQEMGKEIVRQESPKVPGERSRLWNHKDSFNVLKENTGTGKIEGLILDMNFLEDKYDKTAFGVNRKRHFEEFLGTSLLSNVGNSFKRHCFGIFSRQTVGTALRNSDMIALEVDAFERMHKLKLLQLNYLQVNGSFENFPKGLRWLCWHGFSFNSICYDFPLDNLVVLDMQYSNLKKVWEGTKFLESLKILDLSHSHCLSKTPNFLQVPNLEQLILENCAQLVEVHESVGYLQRLVLLNLKDCKNLRKLPRSIVMLQFLETLDISGCSNIKELPIEIRTMHSLTKLNANGTAVSQLLSTTKEVKPWYSFIWPFPSKPRKSVEISWALLPWYVVHLSLVGCNLSEDAFPKDLSNLSSLQILNLSNNPICSLPNCIRGLIGIQILVLDECKRLQSLIVEQNLKVLLFSGCTLLEKVTFQSLPSTIELNSVYDAYIVSNNLEELYYSKCRLDSAPSTVEYNNIWENQFVVNKNWRPLLCTGKCDNIVEFMSDYKLAPIGNIDMEILNNLGLPNLGSMGSPAVALSRCYSKNPRKLPLQGCHEEHIFCVYLPGSKIPTWFNLKNIGSLISFTVPSHFRIQALSVCSIYALSSKCSIYAFSNNPKYHDHNCMAHTIINNTTKSLIWSHSPLVFGIPEVDEDMMWLSYWKFENQLESGDELNISVVGEEGFQVKEVGVHLVYKEQEEKSSQSAREEASQLQSSLYDNVVPGNAPRVHPASKKLFRLGKHWMNCSICNSL
ncbi:TMV resistance protein N-like isoform X1 [Camellia sinensis]|uniref:TMV resistance protein N-like isoform X1 n=1 Tax=Camellia sinensis TaxID=4442 RepID=UPI0010358B89|nr:TMV resistance protein N-like isoform X1 [Camellia sinensis]